jgi:hypothetical protein
MPEKSEAMPAAAGRRAGASRLRRHLLSSTSSLAICFHQAAAAPTERVRKIGAAETPPADNDGTQPPASPRVGAREASR